MMTVVEERDYYYRLLVKVLRASRETQPNEVAAWWVDEQARITARDAAAATRKVARIAELTTKIDALTAERDALK